MLRQLPLSTRSRRLAAVGVRAVLLGSSWGVSGALLASDRPTLYYQGLSLGIPWSLVLVESLALVAGVLSPVFLAVSLKLPPNQNWLSFAVGAGLLLALGTVGAFFGKDMEPVEASSASLLQALVDILPASLLVIAIGYGLAVMGCLCTNKVTQRYQLSCGQTKKETLS